MQEITLYDFGDGITRMPVPTPATDPVSDKTEYISYVCCKKESGEGLWFMSFNPDKTTFEEAKKQMEAKLLAGEGLSEL